MTADGADVPDRLLAVHRRLSAAERAAGRAEGSVDLLLATKTVPVEQVRAAVAAAGRLGGRRLLLGENRVQELVDKGPVLATLGTEVHLIGHLQSNKVAPALRWATCVQSLDSLALARRLSDRAAVAGERLDVMLQVNVSGEESKFGVVPEEAVGAARAIAGLPALRLRGLMTIGAHATDEGVVRSGFARLRELGDAVRRLGAPGTQDAVELSMGMSGDLEAAVAEGTTLVRVGTAVFGTRAPIA